MSLQPLDPHMRSAYATSWEKTQERFTREPEQALEGAGRLVVLLLDERGYPTTDGRLDAVQSDPAGVLQDYRSTQELTARTDLTAIEMRRAMDAYRRIVPALLADERSGRARR